MIIRHQVIDLLIVTLPPFSPHVYIYRHSVLIVCVYGTLAIYIKLAHEQYI